MVSSTTGTSIKARVIQRDREAALNYALRLLEAQPDHTFSDGMVDVEVVIDVAEVIRVYLLGPEPEPNPPLALACEWHKAIQHRDNKPPWCDNCGWNDA